MLKILFVEDNAPNRDLVSRYLELYGYQVESAVDGQEGLKIALDQSSNIDLVLMDMSLPELDGWEVTRRLKANEKTKHIPIIALTAHAMVGDREKAQAAGCDEYETKPVEFKSLMKKIDELCKGAKT